ncbi:MAG: hypothetical protein ACSLFB_14145, partial [Acidimicrobiales bacterium]
RHLLAFASAVGLSERVACNVLDDLLAHLEGLDQDLRDGALGFSENVTIELLKELRFRRRQAQ